MQIVAEINHWPAAIFTELRYENFIRKYRFMLIFFSVDQNLLTFHVLDNAYRINASSVATSFCKLFLRLISSWFHFYVSYFDICVKYVEKIEERNRFSRRVSNQLF